MTDMPLNPVSPTRRRWNLFTGALVIYALFATLFIVLKIYLY